MDQHGWVSKLKDLAVELGKAPTRREFTSRYGWAWENLFGGYTQLIHAAGLEKVERVSRSKEIKATFTVPLSDLTQKRETKVLQVIPETSKRVLSIGDIHAPWGCPDTASLILAICEQLKPTHIVQVGDARDMFSVGNRHPHTRLGYNPKEELDRGTEFLSWFWASLRKAVPQAECFQILGNHDIRPLKRVLESAPDLEVLLDLNRFYKFDGVTLVEDSREVLRIGETAYIHGYKSKNGDHISDLGCNVVHGHTHKAGIIYKKSGKDKVVWEMDIGTCAIGDSLAMSYTPVKLHNMMQGVGLEDDWGPRFIHKP